MTIDDGDADEGEPATFIPKSKPRSSAFKAKVQAAMDVEMKAALPEGDEDEAEEEEGRQVSSRGRKLGKRKVVVDDSTDDERRACTRLMKSPFGTAHTASRPL